MAISPTRRQFALGSLALGLAGCAGVQGEDTSASAPESILASMSLDQKVSQLIIPSVDAGADDEPQWDGMGVTDLDAVPQLAEALRCHQYGGIILYAGNIQGTEQACRLTDALQQNNAKAEASTHVPYLMCADGEGGAVVRLRMGTRMTGAMAVGATGESAAQNAGTTGQILAMELAAVGVNVDFAPDSDVNVNPANPVIGTRSFGDEPQMVSMLACEMAAGISSVGVVPTYKHFPGHGDTGTDSHFGTATVEKTLEELRACELLPFEAAVDAGADLIMTAHITCPKLDEEVTFADGSKGYWPATMSHAILTGILREELGYDGAIVTDALVMDAIDTAHLVEGAEGSAEYAANVAQEVLNAGADILLCPHNLASDADAAFFDDYIDLICKKVEAGDISQERIDQSVRRVLDLKEAHGILGLYELDDDLEERIAEAQKVVGSADHHEAEMAMACEAVTLVKNEDVLPLSAPGKCVLLVRTASEAALADYVVAHLKAEGTLADDACVNKLITGKKSGSKDSATCVTIDYYYDTDEDEAHYTQDLSEAIAQADVVVCETTTWGASALAADSAQRQAVKKAISDAHKAGAKFVQLSDNLPYDVACYTDADAQVLAYMSSGTGVDPTDRAGGSDAPAYNANFVAAMDAIFGAYNPTGTLPVEVPTMQTGADGEATFTDEVLFERGFGILLG